MKKALIAILTLAGVGQAAAADLPPRTYTPAPAYVSPVFNWTGFYVGANLGGAWTSGQLAELATAAAWSNTRAAFAGGGQLGFNYQFLNNLVLGVEWTYDWGGGNGSTSVVPTAAGNLQGSATGAAWLTTLTGRFGVALDRTLLYGKAGGAWIESSVNMTNLTTGAAFTSNSWRTGWVAGAGIEYAFLPNWTVKAEYDYIGASSWTTTTSIVPSGQVKVSGNVQTFLVGVNYKF
ncbi:MAG: outer membrane beta-barrel protein [Xanthobacteraceae bacterium]|nr:outer membrane beta-barrel protein [Xanthobacteraceae bacterium]